MRFKIVTLSPLHIGGREQALLPFEYAVYKGRCYVVNEDRLYRELAKHRLLDDFYKAMLDPEKFSLSSYLGQKKLLNDEFLAAVVKYSSSCNRNPVKELRPFIRNGFVLPYLPGSSIKGALRTSILYSLLKRISESERKKLLDDLVLSQLANFEKDVRKKFRWFQDRTKQDFASQLDSEVFQHFIIRRGQARYGPNSDIMRVLKVSDSDPVGRDLCNIEEIKIYSANSNESPKRWSIHAECIPAGYEFPFQLKIDEQILTDFKKENGRSVILGLKFDEILEVVTKPLEAMRGMTADVLAYEGKFYEKELRLSSAAEIAKKHPTGHLGWGGGLLTTSVSLLLPAELRQRMRNALFVDRGNSAAPKSRRLTQSQMMLGWVKIERVGDL